MTKLREIRHLLICTLLCGFVLGSVVGAGNRAQWQGRVSRNGLPDATGAGGPFGPGRGGERADVVPNRGEAACLAVMAQANGNDGPYMDEGVHLAIGNKGEPNLEPFEVTDIDADIIWLFDLPNKAGTWPHDAAHSSILIDGEFLYINTSNGLDNQHRTINRPDWPSLIVLDKKTGRLLARDNEGIGKEIFHSTWSSPALGVVNGRRLIFFCGGDGIVYAFEALKTAPPEGTVETP